MNNLTEIFKSPLSLKLIGWYISHDFPEYAQSLLNKLKSHVISHQFGDSWLID